MCEEYERSVERNYLDNDLQVQKKIKLILYKVNRHQEMYYNI